MEKKFENSFFNDRISNNSSNNINTINNINESENQIYNPNNKYLNNKRKKIIKHKEKKDFNISHINIDSFFIFDFKNPYDYFIKLKNKIQLN